MSHTPGTIAGEGPEGSIFLSEISDLPDCERTLHSLRTQVLLGRGAAKGLSPEDQQVWYEAILSKLGVGLGGCAVATSVEL